MQLADDKLADQIQIQKQMQIKIHIQRANTKYIFKEQIQNTNTKDGAG